MDADSICFLTTGLAYGGAETQIVNLAIRLKERGWEVQVVSLTPPKAYIKELKAANIPVHSLEIHRKLPDPKPILHLVRLIRTMRPNIVHSHMVHANLLARLIRPIASIPVLICTAHNIDEGGHFREYLYRLTDPMCDLTTQVSQAGLERYVRVGATPQHKIRFIPNGVDTEKFHPNLDTRKRLRKELRLQDTFAWLAVGRFDQQKDYLSMLQAFSKVSQKWPEATLSIVGNGPLLPLMEEQARYLDRNDRVMFLGTGRDIPGLMKASDAYLMSSAWEGMPMVLLEAGSTELPIVATDVGGNSEVVKDSKTGFLTPPKDSDALAKAMLHLMDLSEGERKQMGKVSRQYIETNYSINRVVDQWEALYRKLLSCKEKKVS